MSRDGLLGPIGFFEGVEFCLSDEHGIGSGSSPFVVCETLVLPEILVPGLADDQGTASGLLRDSVVVAGVLERFPVLDPPVPADKNNRLSVM